MGGRAKNRNSSEPEPRQVRDGLKHALQAAYGGPLRTGAFKALGIHGKWNRWGNSFPSGTSLRRLAPDLARVGVSVDDVLLRPHVVPWRIAVEEWCPRAGASDGEVGLWLRIQHGITQRRADTLPPNQGGTLHVRLEAGSPEERAFTEHSPQDGALLTARLARVKRSSAAELLKAADRIDQKVRRSPPVIVFRVTVPGTQKGSFGKRG
jgi:hypothetical protein